MWHKKLIIISIFVAVVICYGCFGFKVELAKQNYRSQITAAVQQLLTQQEWLLQRLSKRLLTPLQKADLNSIITTLRAYEDLSYSLAKQGLGIPVSLYFVSLTAPQLVLSSDGKLDNTALAPDENYYLRVVDNPQKLQLSRSYVSPEMPGYFMSNLGLGVLDAQSNFMGQIDIKFAMQSLMYFIKHQVATDGLFNFEFNKQDLLQPQITINKHAYLLAAIQFGVFWMFCITAVAMGIILGIKLYKQQQRKDHELLLLHKRFTQQFTENAARKQAAIVQDKYGILAANANLQVGQSIDLQELLQDIQFVNAEFALYNGINLDFPLTQDHKLRFYGSQLRLMQILSGMVYEILKQLPTNSTLRLQIEITNLQPDAPQLTFKFSDNGFYSELQDSQSVISYADVRAKGWGYIQQLIELEQGELQHTHTAYSGNTICFIITRKIVNNIVRLAEFI